MDHTRLLAYKEEGQGLMDKKDEVAGNKKTIVKKRCSIDFES